MQGSIPGLQYREPGICEADCPIAMIWKHDGALGVGHGNS